MKPNPPAHPDHITWSTSLERSTEALRRVPAPAAVGSEAHLVEALVQRYGISAAAARRALDDPWSRTTLLAGVESISSAQIRAEVEAEYQREAQLLAADRDKLEADRQARLARAAELEQLEQAQAAETARREREAIDEARGASVRVMAEDRDRKVESLTRFLAGATGGYRSLMHAWSDITRESDQPTPERWKRSLGTMLRDQRSPVYDSAVNRRHESVTAATFGEVFGDAVTRHMVAEYETLPGLQAWRYLVSSIRTSIDFRTQRATRLGGYGQLPVVAEGAPFQPITTAGDEEATYAAAKRGGTEEFTFEAFVNGDGGEVRAIPTKLARAAANTLNRAVLDLLSSNPTLYDTVSLFHASHANTAATALSSTNLYARRKAMRQQAAPSDSTDVIGAVPRFLVIPPDLEEAANVIVSAMPALVNGDAASSGLREPLDLIVANHWTSSATMWFLVANPRTVPTIEVGFTADTPDPQILIGPDPNTDKAFVKVRHAWGLTVVDYRGFQRGNT